MCIFFEFASCGHKHHVPLDPKTCPPEGYVMKDKAGVWAGGCKVEVDQRGIFTEDLPGNCLLLSDPGFGSHDCPVCPRSMKAGAIRGKGYVFSKTVQDTQQKKLAELSAQAEKNLELLIKLGVTSVSELTDNSVSKLEWVQAGIASNRFCAPLPANFKERLGKEYEAPAVDLSARPPKAPKQALSHDFGSVNRQYTHPQYDPYWKEEPSKIPQDILLKGSLPSYLAEDIPSAEHYDLTNAPVVDGRINYQTSGFKSARTFAGDDRYEDVFTFPNDSTMRPTRPPQPTQPPQPPQQPINDQRSPMNPRVNEFVPSLATDPRGPDLPPPPPGPFTITQPWFIRDPTYHYPDPNFPAFPPAPTGYYGFPPFPPLDPNQGMFTTDGNPPRGGHGGGHQNRGGRNHSGNWRGNWRGNYRDGQGGYGRGGPVN